VADSTRLLPARTVGVLWDQDALSVPDMRTKLEYQVAGLGFGFLPEPCATDAAQRGELVILKVDAPRKPEDIVLAWRGADRGERWNGGSNTCRSLAWRRRFL